jgi:hypothetical protein
MTMNSKAFLFAMLLGITAAAPLASASAAAPNTVDNQTYDSQAQPKGSTGVYDDLDRFKDATGHPLQGYGYLFAVPGN